MRILKKINKGLILTIIVLVALTIYLVGVEKQREKDKGTINKVCDEFLECVCEYLVLPEEKQTLNQQISEQTINEYSDKMKKQLEEIMIDNEEAVKIQSDFLKQKLENGYSPVNVRTKYEKEIKKISGYKFDGNRVTVIFNSKVEINTKYLDETNKEKTNQQSHDTSREEIQLQKVEGQWKVVYSNLQFYLDNYFMYDTISL